MQACTAAVALLKGCPQPFRAILSGVEGSSDARRRPGTIRGSIRASEEGSRQSIEERGPLRKKKRMETLEDETSAAIDDMKRQRAAGRPFFCCDNSTRMHLRTHPRWRRPALNQIGRSMGPWTRDGRSLLHSSYSRQERNYPSFAPTTILRCTLDHLRDAAPLCPGLTVTRRLRGSAHPRSQSS